MTGAKQVGERVGDSGSKPPHWGQDRRLEFIDFRLQWEGKLNRADVTDFFGISTPQASLDLARYIDLAPSNLEYDKSAKSYFAAPDFAPALTSSDAQSYLNQLLGVSSGILARDASFCGWLPPVGLVPSPNRHVDSSVLKLALQAIRSSRMMQIDYQSISRASPMQRAISPHAFGFDGYRWHLRAYCHKRNVFRDFVFARMLSVSIGDTSVIDPNTDEEWSREIRLVLAPNPALSEAQQKAIELDYQMTSGQAILRTRHALLFYVLRQLRLDQPADIAPASQQIILVNHDEIQPFIEAMTAKS